MERVFNAIYWLRARLWLIPAVVSAAAFIAANVLVFSQFRLTEDPSQMPWLYSGDPRTARDLLSTILSGMITMASLAVSITMVVLSLAAGQLGPRIILNFTGDRTIQSVIGLFFGTIIYTLVVLRSVNDELGAGNVPHLAISIASLLAIISLFALLAFVSKLARSIVSDTVVRNIASTLQNMVDKLPEADGQSVDEANPSGAYAHRKDVSLQQTGYVQIINYDRLREIASEAGLLLHINVRAGDFVLDQGKHVEVFSHSPVKEDLCKKILSEIVVGAERTPTQDLEFSVRHLVEIALRAVTASHNDPYTTIAVIDRLAAAVAGIWRRELPASHLYDDNKELRINASVINDDTILDVAFDQIRQQAGANPTILAALARRLKDLHDAATGDQQRAAVRRHLQMVERAIAEVKEPDDRAELKRLLESAARSN